MVFRRGKKSDPVSMFITLESFLLLAQPGQQVVRATRALELHCSCGSFLAPSSFPLRIITGSGETFMYKVFPHTPHQTLFLRVLRTLRFFIFLF